jgi:uncharacterized protein YjiS (DUF1127 family)
MSLKHISEMFINWQRQREAVRELSKLSEHELNDLGISRGEIEAAVKAGTRR